jgi:uncharacterized coiled-coil protein SlyX
MKILQLFLALIFTINISMAQSGAVVTKDTLNKGAVNEQFDFVLRKSSNFKNYKVVKRLWLTKLKKHIIDSLAEHKNTIKDAHNKIAVLEGKISELNNQISELNDTLSASNEEKKSISFFGINIEKSQYKLIMWSIIVALLLALLYFIFSYKNSLKVTKESLEKLKVLEDEYSGFRARSLEREQALNRKLIDEINKHK